VSRQVVRNFGSNVTHLVDVNSTTAAVAFGVPYRKLPTDTRALCGVHIRDGVVMQAGTRLKCRACRLQAEEKDEQHDKGD
jgi:hypothetical protein